MGIGIIGVVVVIGLIVWQVFESKKSRLLQIARDEFEDRMVRYEGRVTYVTGPFAQFVPGSELYVSILDGVVCLTSKSREFYAIEASDIVRVRTVQEQGQTQIHVSFTRDAGAQEIVLSAKAERAKMIERYLPVEEKQGA
ncbi:MAG: hypothetical protein ACXVP5_02100 [Tumebacillaceae bacterium]